MSYKCVHIRGGGWFKGFEQTPFKPDFKKIKPDLKIKSFCYFNTNNKH